MISKKKIKLISDHYEIENMIEESNIWNQYWIDKNLIDFQCDEISFVDLLANYVIDNLIDFIDNRVDIEEFAMYCQTIELKLVRIQLFFDLLIKTINQNQDLMIEFLEVFTE